MNSYTADDYFNGVPCYYWSRRQKSPVRVFPINIGPKHKIDNGRLLTFSFANGYTTSRNVDGSELTIDLWKKYENAQ